MNTRSWIAGLATAAAVLGAPRAQTYDDLNMVRGRPSPYASVLQVRAGLLGSFATDEDESIGLEDKLGWDGHVYYRKDRFGERDAVLEAYAGRDGAYLGVVEGQLLGQETQSRLELRMRYFPFYREGFYRDDDFIPTGRYEGLDYGVGLSVAREVADELRFEIGPFYRRKTFDRNDDTASNYVIPDDFNAFGGRVVLEHNTLSLHRQTGRPEHGFILTLAAEWERNDSNRVFGVSGVFESDLPSSLWRGQGHLEWYFPQTDTTTWELEVDAQLTDDKDRVYNYDAQKPQGELWVDGSIGFRMEFGGAFWLTPSGKVQFIRILDQGGTSTENEVFLGAGIEAGYQAGDNMSVLANYSFLSNESRPPVSTSEDTFGEHQFFVGLEARFGATRN